MTILATLSLAGSAATADDLSRTFATCSGRLSALMEHQWLMQDEEADRTEALRAAMLELLELSITPDTARWSLNVRIDAKMAHARLLTLATFSDDPTKAAWARQRADMAVATCTGMLLS